MDVYTLGFGSRRSHADARLRADARGRDDSIRQKLAARMIKKRRTYTPRIVGGKVMMPSEPGGLRNQCSGIMAQCLNPEHEFHHTGS